jgi:hypothetical protein
LSLGTDILRGGVESDAVSCAWGGEPYMRGNNK